MKKGLTKVMFLPPSPRAMTRLMYGIALAWIFAVIGFYITTRAGPDPWEAPADASVLVLFAVVALAPIVLLFATGRVLRRILHR